MKNAIEEFLEAQKKASQATKTNDNSPSSCSSTSPSSSHQTPESSILESKQNIYTPPIAEKTIEEEGCIHLSISVPVPAEELQLVGGAKLRELDGNTNYPLESDYILMACSFLGISFFLSSILTFLTSF